MAGAKSNSDGEDRVQRLEDNLSELTSAVQKLAERLNVMPTTQSSEDSTKSYIQEALRDGSSRRVRDLLNPRAQMTGFQPGDVVRYKETSEKFKAFKSKLKDGQSMPVGVVKTYMYTNRHGLRKYKVVFPDWGRDGCTEDELEYAT